jgi:DNA mismatch repair protein MutL
MLESTPRIHTLPPYLANQIAAGEVIERPASIVKELLENSLDAGATAISIFVHLGGIEAICVQDNGYGVHPDDMLLTLSQHATSKISCSDDLAQIMTLGFRGEALASISAVSQLTLTSLQKNGEFAWQVKAQGKECVPYVQPAAHPLGTRVEVRDLFYNTPARRKFLRSARTEWQYTEEVIKRILLSRFDVDFSIFHNEKKIARYPIITPLMEQATRIAQVFSHAFIENAIKIDANIAGLQLTGFVAPSDFTRSSHDWQYFYVNGRMVKDKLIQHAMRQAFGDTLHPGRYAAYVLYLSLDPKEVDVNVHPTKHEVRFAHTRLIHDFIVSSIADALQRPSPKIVATTTYAAPLGSEVVKSARKLGKFLTVLNHQLIITQAIQGLGVIDLHAYYAYQALHVLNQASIRRQPLLNAQHFKVSNEEQVLLLQQHASLQNLGFVIDQLGELTWLLREIPAILSRADITQLWQILLQQLPDNLRIAQLSCAAIPGAGVLLSDKEIEHILDTVENFPSNASCTHGFKVWQIWSLENLRKAQQ